MRVATFTLDGHREVDLVSPDGRTVTPLTLGPDDALRGSHILIERLVAGQPSPAPSGEPVALSAVRLESPLPLPRRNLWCVGRNRWPRQPAAALNSRPRRLVEQAGDVVEIELSRTCQPKSKWKLIEHQ